MIKERKRERKDEGMKGRKDRDWDSSKKQGQKDQVWRGMDDNKSTHLMTSLSTIRSTISFLASLIMTSYINVKKFHRKNKTIEMVNHERINEKIWCDL